ncbi:hypothetical protein LEMLEM_LOCUS2655 [Lemmus lemmus]
MQGLWSELQRLSTLLDVYKPRNLKCPAVSPSAAHPPLAPPVGEFGGSCKQQPVSAQLSWMLVDLSQKVQISMKVGCSTVFIKI